jgi:UPF0176 protein
MIIAAFYHFFEFNQYIEHRAPLLGRMKNLGIKGTILLSPEGINGTVSGTREAIDELLFFLKTEVAGSDFTHKESVSDTQPFGRAKVRLKKEVISLGEENDPRNPGKYVDAKDWNALIADPDTLVLDARNTYEVHLGTFTNARDPGIRTFKQLPAYVRKHLDPAAHVKIATFCTGGIRCEKFSNWLMGQGFKEVYHLKGGILKYLEEIPESESRWQGECYVFDERVAVGHGLKPSATATMCPACGHALTPEDRTHTLYIEGKRCAFCKDE